MAILLQQLVDMSSGDVQERVRNTVRDYRDEVRKVVAGPARTRTAIEPALLQ